MKKYSYILLIFLAFGQGCSPQRRLSRLLEHHPELTIADTIRIRDTVLTPEVKADTILNLRLMTDTVVVEKERLSVKLIRHNDTLYVEGKCKADTIIRERIIPVEKIKIVKPGIPGLMIGMTPWLILGLLAFMIIRRWIYSRT